MRGNTELTLCYLTSQSGDIFKHLLWCKLQRNYLTFKALYLFFSILFFLNHHPLIFMLHFSLCHSINTSHPEENTVTEVGVDTLNMTQGGSFNFTEHLQYNSTKHQHQQIF